MLRALAPTRFLETQIRPFHARDVTSRSALTERDPAEAGLTRADVDAIWHALERCYESRLYPAVALCLRRKGVCVIDGAIGHVAGNSPQDPPGTELVRATPRTLFNIFSASKAVTAMLVHLLDERRLLHLDDRVCDFIPEFARHGKEWITIRHVLAHRAGIPRIPDSSLDLDLCMDEARVVRLLCDARPSFRPGRYLAYHALTGGYILGEVIRRASGLGVRELLKKEILDPLGLHDMGYGAPESELHRVAQHAFTGLPIPPGFSHLLERALGVDFVDAVRFSNDRRFLTGVVPAGNVIGTAHDVSRFMELMLREGTLEGKTIFDPRTIRHATSEQSYLELDLTMMFPVRFGLGFVLGAKRVSLYGPGTSRAFGHLGFTNVVTWADPERDVAACLMTSGKPFASPGVFKTYGVVKAIAERCSRV